MIEQYHYDPTPDEAYQRGREDALRDVVAWLRECYTIHRKESIPLPDWYDAADALERGEHVSPQEPTRNVSPQDTSKCERCDHERQAFNYHTGKYEPCPDCSGTGKTNPCPSCKGSGDSPHSGGGMCERCGGRGTVIRATTVLTGNPVRCPDCDGTGKTKEQG